MYSNNNRNVVLSAYLQKYIIKILCNYYNSLNESFGIQTIVKSSPLTVHQEDKYYDNNYIDNLALVNKRWFKIVSDNITTIINFNNKLNNKKLNIKQFINFIKQPSSTSVNQNILIKNQNILVLLLDFSNCMQSAEIFQHVSTSKQFRNYINNKVSEYPNLQKIKIRNSSLQFQIDLSNSIVDAAPRIPIELFQITMSVLREEDGLDFDEEDYQRSIDKFYTTEEKELDDQKEMLSLVNYNPISYQSALELSNRIKVVTYANLVQANDGEFIRKINNLEEIKHLSIGNLDISISLFNMINKGEISGRSLVSLKSYRTNYMSFKSLDYFLKLTPNLQSFFIRVCVDQINYKFMDSETDSEDEFKPCTSCSLVNNDAKDAYWDSIVSYFLNSTTLKHFTFIHECPGKIFGQPHSARLSNGFYKYYKLFSNNKQVEIFNIPFIGRNFNNQINNK